MSQPPASQPPPPPEPEPYRPQSAEPPPYYAPHPGPAAPPPYYQPPPVPLGAPPERSRTISILALVFGGAALLFGIIPFAGLFLGGLFGVAAIVLGIIGIFISHRMFAVIGIALAVVGLIVAVIVTIAVGKSAEDIIDDWPQKYEDLTGDGNGNGNGDSDGDGDGNGDGDGGDDAPSQREDEVVDGTDPDAPLPAGAEVETGTWKVTFSNIVPDATEVILENELNFPPAAGYQYFMFQVDASYEGEASKSAWDELFFGVYLDNALHTQYCGFLPNDLSSAPEVYQGGSVSGNACIAVPSGVVEDPLLSVEEYWEEGQRFFVATG